MSTVPETLHAFGPHTLVVRAVGALLAALPDQGAAGRWALDSYEEVDPAVRPLAEDPRSVSILAIGAAVDGADRSMAKRATAESQTADAMVKVVAMAAIGRKVGGDAALLALPTGPALLATWAAVDVVLPLGGVDLKRLLAERRAAATSTFAALVGEGELDGVSAVLDALVPRLQVEIDRAASAVDPIALALAPYVPGLIPAEGGAVPRAAAEAIAAQGDRLPIYKWLAARLALEHAVARTRSVLATGSGSGS